MNRSILASIVARQPWCDCTPMWKQNIARMFFLIDWLTKKSHFIRRWWMVPFFFDNIWKWIYTHASCWYLTSPIYTPNRGTLLSSQRKYPLTKKTQAQESHNDFPHGCQRPPPPLFRNLNPRYRRRPNAFYGGDIGERCSRWPGCCAQPFTAALQHRQARSS